MPTPRRAAVVTPFFVDRDAVCNDVWHGAEALRQAGWETRIFALGTHSEREAAVHVQELPGFVRDPEDLLYFHFSTGHKQLTDIVAGLRCRKLLKFHNITPPEFFAMWSDELAEASRLGREDMRRVAAMDWEHVLGDSAYNLSEIEGALRPGTPKSVLAPFHETEALLAQAPSGPRAGNRMLTVGRITQSKGHPFLLRVMRYLVHELGFPAGLDVVGKPDPRMLSYFRMLKLMVEEYGLQAHVSFHGEVSSAVLAQRYADAAVFVSTSEHEGFCVPVIEAMAFGVPVVALGVTAVPETVGDAGILWRERDPRRFALTLAELLHNPATRDEVGGRGYRRYEASFTNAAIGARFGKLLG